MKQIECIPLLDLYMYIINMGSEAFRSTSNLQFIQRKALRVQIQAEFWKEGTVSEPQSTTKLVETLCPKGALRRFTDFQRGKYGFSYPIPSMKCCAFVRATQRKQQTPKPWMKGRGRGSVDSFVLSVVSLWVQCLNNFVINCRSQRFCPTHQPLY